MSHERQNSACLVFPAGTVTWHATAPARPYLNALPTSFSVITANSCSYVDVVLIKTQKVIGDYFLAS